MIGTRHRGQLPHARGDRRRRRRGETLPSKTAATKLSSPALPPHIRQLSHNNPPKSCWLQTMTTKKQIKKIHQPQKAEREKNQ